ncbi:CENPI isoform 5, partial [Pongo abelii]
MSPQKRVKNVQAQKRTSQGSSSFQTTLSAWKVKQDPSNSKNISKH